MKKIIILVVINILLLGVAFQVTNESAVLEESVFEVGKTYVDKANKNNKIVLYGDYSAEVTKCEEECSTIYGSFRINGDQLEIITDESLLDFQLISNHSFANDNYTFILE